MSEKIKQSAFLRYWWFQFFRRSSGDFRAERPLTEKNMQDVYFVRINSSAPISRVVSFSAFKPLFPMLAELGLGDKPAAAFPP